MKEKVNCKIIEDLLLPYLDGTLNPETTEIIEKHFEECEECKKKLEDLKSTIIEEKENDKKCIDYLKKAKRKERIKTIKMILIVVIAIVIIACLRKIIIFNNMVGKAKKALSGNNIYMQIAEYTFEGQVNVTKKYYKDGKYKELKEEYVGDEINLVSIEYIDVETKDFIQINVPKKEVSNIKYQNTKEAIGIRMKIKNNEMYNDDRIIIKTILPITSSIHSERFTKGSIFNEYKNCYVIENSMGVKTWIDKETGLPLKEIGRGQYRSYYDNITGDGEIRQSASDIIKSINDEKIEYRYEFGTVTDKDVSIPDISKYQED